MFNPILKLVNPFVIVPPSMEFASQGGRHQYFNISNPYLKPTMDGASQTLEHLTACCTPMTNS